MKTNLNLLHYLYSNSRAKLLFSLNFTCSQIKKRPLWKGRFLLTNSNNLYNENKLFRLLSIIQRKDAGKIVFIELMNS